MKIALYIANYLFIQHELLTNKTKSIEFGCRNLIWCHIIACVVQVSLNEVQGQSLEEWELWGVLFQTTEAVQDGFWRGKIINNFVT